MPKDIVALVMLQSRNTGMHRLLTVYVGGGALVLRFVCVYSNVFLCGRSADGETAIGVIALNGTHCLNATHVLQVGSDLV